MTTADGQQANTGGVELTAGPGRCRPWSIRAKRGNAMTEVRCQSLGLSAGTSPDHDMRVIRITL